MGGMWLLGLVCMAAFLALVVWLVRRFAPQEPVTPLLGGLLKQYSQAAA